LGKQANNSDQVALVRWQWSCGQVENSRKIYFIICYYISYAMLYTEAIATIPVKTWLVTFE